MPGPDPDGPERPGAAAPSAAAQGAAAPGATIVHLRLSHLRSYRNAVLDVGDGPVALYGGNGAGKTNILEAISLLAPGRGLRGAATEDLARIPEGVGWKIAARLRTGGQAPEVETWAEPGMSRQVRLDGKPASQVALGRAFRVLWLTPAMDRLWIEAPAGRRRFLDRTTLSFEPSHATAAIAYDKAMRQRNRLLRDGVRDPHWYHALERQMAVAGADVRANRQAALGHLARHAGAGSFPGAHLSIEEPDTGDLRDALARSRPGDMRAGRTQVGPHLAELRAIYADKGMPASDSSTGEQKALLISILLANARALIALTGSAPILLLDEVAAHLDADRRRALYDEVTALRVQAWMTGTERPLFDGLAALRVRIAEADGASAVVPE